MLTLVRSRTQGDSREPKTRRVRQKVQPEGVRQTQDDMLVRARDVLKEVAPSRVRLLVNNKPSFRPLKSAELKKVLKDGGVVRANRELSHLTKDEAIRHCVKLLLREGSLELNKWGEFTITTEALAQVS